MRPLPVLALALVALAGCKLKEDDVSTQHSTTSGGVAPMTSGAAGGMAPVGGGESVEGAGSGVNSSAIDAAQRAAAKAGAAPSMGDAGGG